MKPVYIFGHRNPDTDSICSSIALSYLKNSTGWYTIAKTVGHLNNETKYVLNYFKVPEPEYLNDVRVRIKNIDYDLDVKLYPDGYYEILDEDEFEQHSKQMNYSTDIINIVEGQMKELIRRMEACEEPFNNETIRKYYKEYD